jgi:hypothetical protein
MLTDLFAEWMKDLGEDPAAFRHLHEGFIDSLRPANLLEEALVADLAKLWWKKARAERAQAAYQVHEIEKLERQHRQKLLGMGPEDRPGEEVIAGTVRISESCATNYHQVIGPLVYLLETVDKGDWLEEPQDLLAKIYGQFPTPRGLLIKQMFAEWTRAAESLDDARERQQEEKRAAESENPTAEVTDEAVEPIFSSAPEEGLPAGTLDFQELLGQEPAFAAPEFSEGPASPGAEREMELRAALKRLLLEEIHEVTREYELYQTALAPLSPATRIARMAPCGEWHGGRGNAWPLMLRQEASLERQLDRKLRLLLKFREAQLGNGHMRSRPTPPPPRGDGGNGSRMPRRRHRLPRGGQRLVPPIRPARRANAPSASRSPHGGVREVPKQSRYVHENKGAVRRKWGDRVKRNSSPGVRKIDRRHRLSRDVRANPLELTRRAVCHGARRIEPPLV